MGVMRCVVLEVGLVDADAMDGEGDGVRVLAENLIIWEIRSKLGFTDNFLKGLSV